MFTLLVASTWMSLPPQHDTLVRAIIDRKSNRFAKRENPFREAIEHLPHEAHRPLSSVKIDPE
jgi:hypothetical protein